MPSAGAAAGLLLARAPSRAPPRCRQPASPPVRVPARRLPPSWAAPDVHHPLASSAALASFCKVLRSFIRHHPLAVCGPLAAPPYRHHPWLFLATALPPPATCIHGRRQRRQPTTHSLTMTAAPVHTVRRHRRPPGAVGPQPRIHAVTEGARARPGRLRGLTTVRPLLQRPQPWPCAGRIPGGTAPSRPPCIRDVTLTFTSFFSGGVGTHCAAPLPLISAVLPC